MKNDWKYNHFTKYAEAIRKIQSRGVTVNGCFILGLDKQTPDIFNQVFEFVRASELYEVQVTILTPFPGTALYQKLKSEQRILEPENWKKCTLFDINFIPSDMTVEQLDAGFKGLVQKLYSREFTNQRRNLFKENLRLRRCVK